MPPLKGDEEVKEEKGLEISTPNKFLPRLPILLAQVKRHVQNSVCSF